MGSAIRSNSIQQPIQTQHQSLRGSQFFVRWRHILGPLILSLPFIIIFFLATQSFYLSDGHAYDLARVLLVKSDPEYTLLDFNPPEFSTFILLAYTDIRILGILGSLVGGGLLWLLWLQLGDEIDYPLRIAIMLLFMISPAITYTATQSFSNIVALFLMAVATFQFLGFIETEHTSHGFVTGTALGFAFYVYDFTVFFTIAFTLLAFIYVARHTIIGAKVSMIVIFFPTALAIVGWAYVHWVLRGSGWYTINLSIDQLVINQQYAANLAAYEFNELGQVPLYLTTGLLLVVRNPSRLLFYVTPLIIFIGARFIGLNYSILFAIGTYMIFAVVNIPGKLYGLDRVFILASVVLQLTIAASWGIESNGLDTWVDGVVGGEVSAHTRTEKNLAQTLNLQPSRSILADNRTVYRLIARSGSGEAFLMPAHQQFSSTVTNPAEHVNLIVLGTDEDILSVDRVMTRIESFSQEFVFDQQFEDWVIYRSSAMRPIVYIQ